MAVSNRKRSRPRRRGGPARSAEARENQIVNLAYDVAEEQLSNGTASSQVITHFLKLGSQRAKLEMDKLEEENKLLRARTEALASAKRIEELYKEALNAMRSYSGQDDVVVEDDFDE